MCPLATGPGSIRPMPRPLKAPPKEKMLEYIERGLTQQEMADEWSRESGDEVARSTISVAMARYELNGIPRERHGDLLPWTLRSEHRYHRDARYLRLESRRGKGGSLTEAELRRLDAWKRELMDRDAVIYYDADSPGGWWWIRRQPFDGVLIRHPEALIPWAVSPKHQGTPEFALLSLEVRRRKGEQLEPHERDQLDKGIADLEARAVVLDYGPRKGWTYLPMGDGDTDLVRFPEAAPARRPVAPVTWETGRHWCQTCKERIEPADDGRCAACGTPATRILGQA